MLKPQDILVALKLVADLDKKPVPLYILAKQLEMSGSEVHASVKRLQVCRLLRADKRLYKDALLEFLVHGLQYVFPAVFGSITRGIPTSFAAPPLNKEIVSTPGEILPVWAHAEGNARGMEIEPIYRTAPDIARKDPAMYELLALLDALRGGRARERNLAIKHFEGILSNVRAS